MDSNGFCPARRCDGSGWILDEEANVARPCECREVRINRVSSRRLGTGIPKRFRGVSFERKPICDLDPHLLADIKETYEDGAGRSYMELFRRLCEVDLLHLDDLGAERRTEWVLEQLYSIINERWQDERAVVVTTNLDLDELREQVGWRTVSRLMEICGEPIPIMGPDRRILSSP